MSSRTPLALLFLSLAVIAGAIYFWPAQASEPIDLREGAAMDGVEHPPEAKLAEASEGDVATSVDTARMASESGRTTLSDQRVIEVVDPKGKPVANAKVHYRVHEASERELAEFEKFMASGEKMRLWTDVDKSPFRTTDAQGRARIPEIGVGFAAVIEPGMEGAAIFGQWDADNPTPVLLQLEPVTDFEVLVVTHEGEPAEGIAVAIEHETTSDKERRALGELRGMPQVVGRRATTDAQGRARLASEFPESELKASEVSAPDSELRVRAWVPLGVELTEAIEVGRTEPVRLTLPPSGGARIRLNGYPEGIVPVIADARDLAFHRQIRSGSAIPQAERAEDGAFVFEHLPLNRKFEVQFQSVSEQASGRRFQSTSFTAESLVGPSVLGELVEAEFTLATEGTLVGQLLDADSKPATPPTRTSRDLRLLARVANPEIRPFALQIELAEDGSFIARISDRNPHGFQIHDIVELLFERERRLEYRTNKVESPALWARVPVQIDAGTRQFDLGEIQLGQEDPILRIHVVDLHGNPVPDARLRFRREGRQHQLRDELDWVSATVSISAFLTDEDGWSILPGFSFEDAIAPRDSDLLESTGRARVTVVHSDYLETEKVFTSADRELEVVLGRAVKLSGRARVPIGLDELWVVALEPGEQYQGVPGFRGPKQQLYSGHEGASTDDEGVVVPFELSPIRPGSCDLVFYFHGSDREVLRMNGVAVPDDAELADIIDLNPFVDHLALTILDQNGNVLTGEQEGQSRIMLMHQSRNGRGSGGSGATWRDGKIHAFMPRGEPMYGWLSTEGSRAISLVGLAPGEHVLQFDGPRTVRCVFRHTAELPEGQTLEATLMGGGRGRVELLENEPGSDLTLELGSTSNIMISWTRRSAEGRTVGYGTQTYLLTEAQITGADPIELIVPDLVFQPISRR